MRWVLRRRRLLQKYKHIFCIYTSHISSNPSGKAESFSSPCLSEWRRRRLLTKFKAQELFRCMFLKFHLAWNEALNQEYWLGLKKRSKLSFRRHSDLQLSLSRVIIVRPFQTQANSTLLCPNLAGEILSKMWTRAVLSQPVSNCNFKMQ